MKILNNAPPPAHFFLDFFGFGFGLDEEKKKKKKKKRTQLSRKEPPLVCAFTSRFDARAMHSCKGSNSGLAVGQTQSGRRTIISGVPTTPPGSRPGEYTTALQVERKSPVVVYSNSSSPVRVKLRFNAPLLRAH